MIDCNEFEDRETPQMHKYGERETTWIMMATVCHVTCSSGLRKFQTDGFLLDGVYFICSELHTSTTGQNMLQ